MITNHFYSSKHYRPIPEGKKIIDIGGSTSYAYGFLDAVVDIQIPQAKANHTFIGDMNEPVLWEQIHAHVKEHGKWDYAICSHTLEDIANPIYAAKQIEKIAHAGIIITPSKYRELARFSGSWRGYKHHRWVFQVENNELIGYPKSAYLEDAIFDDVHLKLDGREELVCEWTGEIGLKEVNNGMPFSGDGHLVEQYQRLLND